MVVPKTKKMKKILSYALFFNLKNACLIKMETLTDQKILNISERTSRGPRVTHSNVSGSRRITSSCTV